MAFSPKNGRRGLVAEINVTPLVDVMLVLLIIFMVTAPMMTQGVDVTLPETTAKPLPQKEKPLIITLDRQGVISLDKTAYSRLQLHDKLAELARADRERPVFLSADQNVPYGQVIKVMADVKEAGFDKLGMITKPVEDPARQ
jgi:biopolymer transport protein TolR